MKIAVCGIYQTQFGELWDKSLEDLIIEASKGCLSDASIDRKKVQSVFVGNMLAGHHENQQHLSALICQSLSIKSPVTRIEAACASGGMAVRLAVQAINSGEIDNALVLGAEKMTDLDSQTISQALMSAASQEEQSAGLTFPGLYALLAQQYINEFEAHEKHLAQVAVKNHFHASLNPKAHFRFKISKEDVLNSQPVSNPLKLLDCSPITDGAAAVFLASPSYAKSHCLKNGVYITGSSQAQDSLSLSQRSDLTTLSATKKAAKKAYKQAGIKAKDANVIEVHDCFTIAEILALEDLGLFQKGEGYSHINKKEVFLGGNCPVNTSGGLKACGHPVGATGVKQIVEATSQLRGEAGSRQVVGAKLAITQNIGGTGGTAVVHVLKN
jgi:acetyl-CoA C-acetyltransferase